MGSEVITLYYTRKGDGKMYYTPPPPNSEKGGVLFEYIPSKDLNNNYKNIEFSTEESLKIAQNSNTGEYCVLRKISFANIHNYHQSSSLEYNYGFLDLITNDGSWSCSIAFQSIIDRNYIDRILIMDVMAWDQDMFLIVGGVSLKNGNGNLKAFRAFITGSQNKQLDKTFQILRMDIFKSNTNYVNNYTVEIIHHLSDRQHFIPNPINSNDISYRAVVYNGLRNFYNAHTGSNSRLPPLVGKPFLIIDYFSNSDEHNGIDVPLSTVRIDSNINDSGTFGPTKPINLGTSFTDNQYEETTIAFNTSRNTLFFNLSRGNINNTSTRGFLKDIPTIQNDIFLDDNKQKHLINQTTDPVIVYGDKYYRTPTVFNFKLFYDTGYIYSSKSYSLHFKSNAKNTYSYTTASREDSLHFHSNYDKLTDYEAKFYLSSKNNRTFDQTYINQKHVYYKTFENVSIDNTGPTPVYKLRNILFSRFYNNFIQYNTKHVNLSSNYVYSVFTLSNGETNIDGSYYDRSRLAYIGVFKNLYSRLEPLKVWSSHYCNCYYKGPGSNTQMVINGQKLNTGHGTIALWIGNKIYLVRPKIFNQVKRDILANQFWETTVDKVNFSLMKPERNVGSSSKPSINLRPLGNYYISNYSGDTNNIERTITNVDNPNDFNEGITGRSLFNVTKHYAKDIEEIELKSFLGVDIYV